MAGSVDARRRRRALVTAAVMLALFGLGVVVGSQLAGGSRAAAVPAGVALSPKAAQPDSSQSALDAAAGFATVMAQVFPLDPTSAQALLAADASDAYRATLLQSVAAVLVPLQQQMASLAGRPVFRQSVLGERLNRSSPGQADVSAWVMVVAGQSGVSDNAVCSFSTVDLQLVFERAGWRINASTETPGPSPQMVGAPTSVDVLVQTLTGFNDWRPR